MRIFAITFLDGKSNMSDKLSKLLPHLLTDHLDLDHEKVKVTIEQIVERKHALNAARNTVSKKFLDKEPSREWWRKILMARHSPIRVVKYLIKIEGVPEWVQTHLVRHHIGVEKFVSTQRTDRTGDERKRSEIPQGEEKIVLLDINSEAIINISRKRCCSQSSNETRYIWFRVLQELQKIDPELVNLCVPECVHMGFCPELRTCGFCRTSSAKLARENYMLGYEGTAI